MPQEEILVGTPTVPVDLDTQFGKIQNNFEELYGGEYGFDTIPISWCADGTTPPDALDVDSRPPIKLRKFDPAVQQDVMFRWFVPNDIDATMLLQYQVLYVITSASGPVNNGVVFELAGASMGDGDITNPIVGSYIALAQSGITAAQWTQKITNWSASVTVPNLAAGEASLFRLRRAVGDASDDYTQAIGVEAIRIRYIKKTVRP